MCLLKLVDDLSNRKVCSLDVNYGDDLMQEGSTINIFEIETSNVISYSKEEST